MNFQLYRNSYILFILLFLFINLTYMYRKFSVIRCNVWVFEQAMLAVPFVSARMQVTTHHILKETFLAITMSWLVRESLLGMRESQVETWCASYLLVCLNYHGSCKKSRLGQKRGVFLALVFCWNVVFIRLLVSEILPPKRWNQCQQRGGN